jgi:hypothetical protein
MASMMLGDSTLESLTPSVNAPLRLIEAAFFIVANFTILQKKKTNKTQQHPQRKNKIIYI